MRFHRYSLVMLFLAASLLGIENRIATAIQSESPTSKAQDAEPKELPTIVIPHPGSACEAYFSPDGESLICNAKLEGDETYYVYTMNIDGTNVRKINGLGMDACSFYFPDGKRLIWTSTRDHLDFPPGNYSETSDYPKGAELFVSDLNGGSVKRLTDNSCYDAEVSVSPDGQWILFSRQDENNLDLWRMRPDGSEQAQITRTTDWQEGGAFFMPDSDTIIYRAWKTEDGKLTSKPMTIFTIKVDGTECTQITDDPGTNWAPFPAPDGKHFVYVRILPKHNYEIFLMNIQTKKKTQLTFNNAFDAYPVISPDGRTLLFSSSRDIPKEERQLRLVRMDVSSLDLGVKNDKPPLKK